MLQAVKISVITLYAFLAIAWVNPSTAADTPTQFIERLASTAIGTLTESSLSLEERQDRFRTLLRDGFDIDGAARFLLGPFQRKATEQDLMSFRDALEDNVVATYAWRFRSYNGQKFTVLGERDGRRGRRIVSSVIQPVDGSQSITIDWTLTPHEDTWRIFDIVVAGLSMIVTQRDEYAAVIRRNGGKIDALTDALRAQSEKLNSRQRSAAAN